MVDYCHALRHVVQGCFQQFAVELNGLRSAVQEFHHIPVPQAAMIQSGGQHRACRGGSDRAGQQPLTKLHGGRRGQRLGLDSDRTQVRGQGFAGHLHAQKTADGMLQFAQRYQTAVRVGLWQPASGRAAFRCQQRNHDYQQCIDDQ